MSEHTVICQEERRRSQVRAQADRWNGLDYLEVSADQLSLTVYFLNKAPAHIGKENVIITGGRRIRDIHVIGIRVCRVEDDERDDCMQVWLDRYGDFSTYTLCLVEVDEQGRPRIDRDKQGRQQYRPQHGFDARYAHLDFTFKAGCPSDLDCKTPEVCPPPERMEPEINYLARDYASFRQLILDRLALIMPEWQERHVPDLGITLVEILAYAGDHLSYYQDAVATEAYLDTARQRISVRRHARLVDYPMHEGCNARAWVFVETTGDARKLEAEDFYLVTRCEQLRETGAPLTPDDLRAVPSSDYEVFEPLAETPDKHMRLLEAHNRIRLYTWGDRQCCLPRGATRATLVDGAAHYEGENPPSDARQQSSRQKRVLETVPEERIAYGRVLDLQGGDFLLFEEMRGPQTGNPADADPAHRHVVRLTSVEKVEDRLLDPPLPLLEVEWAEEDALPFPLCVSAIVPGLGCQYREDISVARGNIILVDHGRTVADEGLPAVPPGASLPVCQEEGRLAESAVEPGRYRPALERAPLTFGQPLPVHASTHLVPAARLLQQDPRQALPHVSLQSKPAPFEGGEWAVRRDLLGSSGDDPHFVVEMDDDGRAHLRFGDGELGRRPEAGTTFEATYRVGNGPAGNVGAGAIAHAVRRHAWPNGVTLKPRNPMPACGGVTPEPLADVKLFAPYAFRKELQRAITPDDYASLVMRGFNRKSAEAANCGHALVADKVQRAAATLSWTGSWYEVLVAIDPQGQEEADQALLDEIREYLEPYRRIGHDLRVVGAHYVPLDIQLTVCVRPDYLRGHVKAALLELFSNRRLPDGRLGFFHPDNLTFGEGVLLSRLIALARSEPGVENVVVDRLQRYAELPNQEVENGVLPLGPFEIARLDNDPSFPEHGILALNVRGGR